MEREERKTHTIDATDQRLGHMAVKIALLLRGKQKPQFAMHKDVGDFVVVKNARRMQFSGKKLSQKLYRSHSGYLGSLREKRLEDLFAERPGEVVRRAVWGMLPDNKLRAQQIKRMTVEE